MNEKMKLKQLNPHTTEVDIPLTDVFGDSITLFIHTDDEKPTYTVTDIGYTMWNLSTKGVDINDPKINKLVSSILKPENVELNKKSKELIQTGADLPKMLNNVTQAVIKVSSSVYTTYLNNNKEN